MDQKNSSLRIVYHKFFVYLPVILIIFLITLVYVSYWIFYITPLLQNWNTNVTKNSLEYPFAITSNKKSSRSKGIFLGITSGIFVILLMINLLRTIFSDPGYFPSALDMEYKIVMKNLIHEEEERNKEKNI